MVTCRHGTVDRVGFRLLAEIPSHKFPHSGREAGLAAAVEAFCNLYSTITDSRSEVSLIRSEEQTRNLVTQLLDRERNRPVVIVSMNKGADRASSTRFDPWSFAKAANGLAHVSVMASSQSRLFTQGVGRKLAVFNGAVRVYLPGLEKDTDPGRHRLHCSGRDPSSDEVEQSWLSLLRLVARESANSYRKNGGRLPYGALEHKAARLKKRSGELGGTPASTVGNADSTGSDKGTRTTAPVRDRVGDWVARHWTRFLEPIRSQIGRASREYTRPKKGTHGDPEFVDLNRKLSKIEADRKGLTRKLKTARERNKELVSKNRQLQHSLAERDERIAGLKASLAATRPLPDSWDRVIGWCDTELSGRLMLITPVRRDLPRAQYEDVETATRGLQWLATSYRDARLNGRGEDLRGPVPGAEGLSNERCGSDSFTVKWQGEPRKVEWHLRQGTSHDPRHCLRIYYFWDTQLDQVVVASMPAHRVSPD